MHLTTPIPSDEERELRRTVAVISGLLAVHYAHQPLPRRKGRTPANDTGR